MRDQYAADISDYLKCAFLRAVAGEDRRLGMAWYYLPGHDGRPDGRHVEYKAEPAWRGLDATLYDQLVALRDPSVAALERLAIWPSHTVFHRVPVAARTRKDWIKGMVRAMANADFVFLDPDNGLGRGATKHARIDDLIALRRECRESRLVSIIKFPGRRTSYQDQVCSLHRALRDAGFVAPLTVVTCVRVAHELGRRVPRHRFLTVTGGDAEIRARVERFVQRLNTLDAAACVRAQCITT